MPLTNLGQAEAAEDLPKAGQGIAHALNLAEAAGE
jgi:hypothetical protein